MTTITEAEAKAIKDSVKSINAMLEKALSLGTAVGSQHGNATITINGGGWFATVASAAACIATVACFLLGIMVLDHRAQINALQAASARQDAYINRYFIQQSEKKP